MKKQLIILAALVVILVCSSVAAIVSTDRKTKAKPVVDPQVAALHYELSRAQITMFQHDATNEANLKNSATQILTLQQQKTTLCTQIKAARLAQPLCQ